MFRIAENELLSKVERYELFRTDKKVIIYIEVHHFLAGETKNKFLAIPQQFLAMDVADKKYHGYGESEIEAVNDCLSKIKNVPHDVILPPRAQKESPGTPQNW